MSDIERRSALVTGATGFIATRLVPALVSDGWRVRATGRRDRPAWLAPEVEYQPADLAGAGTGGTSMAGAGTGGTSMAGAGTGGTSMAGAGTGGTSMAGGGEDDLGGLLEGVTHVFHLAGASSSQSSDEEMQRSNVVGTGRLVDAARTAGIERFLHMSSTSVYGEKVQLPLPVREDVEPQPSRGYGQAKWGAEKAVWKAAGDGLPAVVLRPVSVYGPGSIKLVASAILDVAVERFTGLDVLAVPNPAIEQRLVHIDDLVAASLHLAGHDDAVGKAFNVTSGVYPSSHEIASILAGQFEMKVELSDDSECGPGYDERRAVRERMLAQGMRGDILLTKERFRFMRKTNRNNRLSIDALLGTGFEPRETDVAASIGRNVAWCREQRWVL